MIEFLSSWAKGLGVTIVVVSIFEMLLPNNNTKKYIRMVLGVYVIFNIISPLIQNKEIFDWKDVHLGEYQTMQTSSVDQTSMDERIKELYEEELERDIAKKVKEKGYEVIKCKVSTQISDNEEESKIEKIKLTIQKKEEPKKETENTENKIVAEIQKIKKVSTNIEVNHEKKTENTKEKVEKVTKTDIQNIKKFLIEEYGVSEKCLEIN
ncbi:MAG: stage III sporulation protein AF [Clostridia bacterium]|nr:stage III sporulation protein AF [Clostridia bacterium]